MRPDTPKPTRAVQFACALILAGLSLAGCAPAKRHQAIDARIIDDPSIELFSATEILDSVVVFEWDLTDPEEQGRWANRGGSILRKERKGLHLGLSTESGLELRRKTDFQAETTDALTFLITGMGRGSVMFRWAGPDQPFEKRWRLTLGTSASKSGRYRFEVASHPGWTGNIGRVALRAFSNTDAAATLSEVTGLKLVTNSDKLTRALSRPWRVRLQGDVRSAILSPPGVPNERELDVPELAELSVAFGVTLSRAPSASFRISATPEGGPEVDLLNEVVTPGGPLKPGEWYERRVPLDQFAGQRVRLRLETSSKQPWSLSKGVPVWASPEILVRRRGRPPVNVVLISIDTLRADRLSVYGYSRETSPQLAQLAEAGGIVFENVVASAPWTLPSHVSMFTGLDALTHGVNFSEAAPARLDMLAERFQRHGYRTVAFSAGAYLNPKFGLAQGFDLYRVRHQPSRKADTDDELSLGLAQFREWLGKEEPRPFFAFFHSYEVHAPYRLREPYFQSFGGDPARVPGGMISTGKAATEDGYRMRKRFVWPVKGRHDDNPSVGPEDLDLVSTLYDSGIAYMDSQLGEFLRFLEASGLSENTIVALTSDHGEALGEHGVAAHGYLWDDNLMVPLILWLPGGQHAGSRIPTQVRSVDLTPTLLDYAGLPVPEDIDGVSLRSLIEGTTNEGPPPAWSLAASTGRGVSVRVSNRLKYLFLNVAWAPVYGREILYDLRADSREQRNLAPDHSSLPDLRALARRELKQRLPGLRVRLSNEGERTLEGSLESARISRSSVSSFDLDCACVHYLKSGRLNFEVPPGHSYTLILSRLVGGDLELEIRPSGDGPGVRRSIAVNDLEEPYVLSRREAGWVQSSDETPATAQISVWWPEGLVQAGEREVDIDPELEAQLKALGYLQ